MTITFERRLVSAGVKSRYVVLVDGVEVGEVAQLHDRSFSGAWYGHSFLTGRTVTRCATRAAAAASILPEPEHMPALCFHTDQHCGATATSPCAYRPRRAR